jgi:hypothetical protein
MILLANGAISLNLSGQPFNHHSSNAQGSLQPFERILQEANHSPE